MTSPEEGRGCQSKSYAAGASGASTGPLERGRVGSLRALLAQGSAAFQSSAAAATEAVDLASVGRRIAVDGRAERMKHIRPREDPLSPFQSPRAQPRQDGP